MRTGLTTSPQKFRSQTRRQTVKHTISDVVKILDNSLRARVTDTALGVLPVRNLAWLTLLTHASYDRYVNQARMDLNAAGVHIPSLPQRVDTERPKIPTYVPPNVEDDDTCSEKTQVCETKNAPANKPKRNPAYETSVVYCGNEGLTVNPNCAERLSQRPWLICKSGKPKQDWILGLTLKEAYRNHPRDRCSLRASSLRSIERIIFQHCV